MPRFALEFRNLTQLHRQILARNQRLEAATTPSIVSQYERDRIGARTREGMIQRRAEGVHIGRPRVLSADVLQRISAARSEGRSLREIAQYLTAAGISTAHGGANWRASTVRGVFEVVAHLGPPTGGTWRLPT